MTRSLICKLLQRKTYDILTKKYTVVALFVGMVVIIVSVLHFGETMMEWSRDKYSSLFFPFTNNIAGRSYQKKLCQHVPIDVVYSWVNGTDRNHLDGLAQAKRDYGFATPYGSGCTLSVCIESHIILVKPSFPPHATLSDLEEAYTPFENIIEASAITANENITLLMFSTIDSARLAAKTPVIRLDSQNYTLTHAFLTDNWFSHGTISMKNLFVVLDLPDNLSSKGVIKQFPVNVQKTIKKVFLHASKHYAIITVSDSWSMDHFMMLNSSALKKEVSVIAANLVLELPSDHEDISASRFTDNEELRYSLRSLEKHAPWVQHVYIITNGQIPHWLNLDNSRITIVTHEEIFLNKSHLPTYSSPAIECHLHRIPNLSKKFLYLNDDVMFGKDVWPEDFYTHTRGQKVYLSWPVPNCADGCPPSWIRDGYCDKPCNNSLCQWDGGDCTSDNPMLTFQGVALRQEGATNVFRLAGSKDNCNQDCLNTWLADRYCDKPCNVKACGYDAGDCGLDHFDELQQIQWQDKLKGYRLPDGEHVGFINLTTLVLSNVTITDAFYNEHRAARALAISLKYSILTLVLNPRFNETRLDVTFRGKKDNKPYERRFSIIVNPRRKALKATVGAPAPNATEEPFVFEEFPKNFKFPKVLALNDTSDQYAKVDLFASNITGETAVLLEELNQLARNAELTEKGYWNQKSALIHNYVSRYFLEYKLLPPLVYDNNQTFASVVISSVVAINESKEVLGISSFENVTLGAVSQARTRHLLMLHDKSRGPDGNGSLPSFRGDQLDGSLQEPDRLKSVEPTSHSSLYETPSVKNRNLLDTFGDSLRHVNKLYNEAFGFVARKVPSHIAHFVDRDIMERLYTRFNRAFEITSAHKIRRPDDMQFAFSYYYYLMSERETVTVGELFDILDVDASGTWSDREIRTLLTRMNDLPLEFSEVSEFHQIIINCSSKAPTPETPISTPHYERFYESNLPVVTKRLIQSCKPICDMLTQQFGERKRNPYEVTGEDEVAFKMIHNNLTHVLSQIDDIRKNPKKFVCLNDNMKHGTPEAEVIRTVIQDFYESMFPVRSQFELPPDYRNRFLYTSELKQWRRMRDLVRFATYLSLGVLILFTITSFWKSEIKPKVGGRSSRKRSGGRSYLV